MRQRRQPHVDTDRPVVVVEILPHGGDMEALDLVLRGGDGAGDAFDKVVQRQICHDLLPCNGEARGLFRKGALHSYVTASATRPIRLRGIKGEADRKNVVSGWSV